MIAFSDICHRIGSTSTSFLQTQVNILFLLYLNTISAIYKYLFVDLDWRYFSHLGLALILNSSCLIVSLLCSYF